MTQGSWTNSPNQFAYQWLRCEGYGEAGTPEELGTECEPITVGKELATHQTYEVQSQDVAHTIIATVEARNGAGASVAVTSPEVILATGEENEPPFPIFTQRPTLSGAAVQGDTLTAHRGVWENSPTSYLEKWFRCHGRTEEGIGATCGVITVKNGMGENEPYTGETYVPSAEDVGFWIEVQERATNPGWLGSGALAGRADLDARAPRKRLTAHDHGVRRTGADADGRRRLLDERPFQPPLAVDALLRRGPGMLPDVESDQVDPQHHPQRRRPHAGGLRIG